MATEKRLIDANALLQKLSRMIDYCKNDNKVCGLTALFQVGDAIMDCHTVDAVEVVRCKDCKHYHPMKPYPSYNGSVNYCCRSGYIKVSDNDFCSYGEKREEHQQDCTYNKNGHCMGQKMMPECDAKNCDRRK